MVLDEDPGCWAQTKGARYDGRPALFLDRDGVVVVEVNYLGRVQDVTLEPAAGPLIAAYNRAGVPVVLVTNQSGVARSYFSWEDFGAVQTEIDRRLAFHDARIDAVFACAHHERGRSPLAVPGHPWRKPQPGMFLAARERMGVGLAGSIIVGDRAQDLAAGRAAGVRAGVQVATGHGTAEEQARAATLRTPDFDVVIAADIGGAEVFLPALTGGASA